MRWWRLIPCLAVRCCRQQPLAGTAAVAPCLVVTTMSCLFTASPDCASQVSAASRIAGVALTRIGPHRSLAQAGRQGPHTALIDADGRAVIHVAASFDHFRTMSSIPDSPDMAPRRATVRLMLKPPGPRDVLGFRQWVCRRWHRAPWARCGHGSPSWVMQPYLSPPQVAALLLAGFFVGWWACTFTARSLATPDPGSIVWDEVLAFWLVLWLVTPASLIEQRRCLRAVPVLRCRQAGPGGLGRWAVQRTPRVRRSAGRRGFGILFDDLVAALCTLLVISVWRWL